jgi:hypothetical protein
MMEKLIKKSAMFSAVLIEVLPIVRLQYAKYAAVQGGKRSRGEKEKLRSTHSPCAPVIRCTRFHVLNKFLQHNPQCPGG